MGPAVCLRLGAALGGAGAAMRGLSGRSWGLIFGKLIRPTASNATTDTMANVRRIMIPTFPAAQRNPAVSLDNGPQLIF
jgi:hypothetical protein